MPLPAQIFPGTRADAGDGDEDFDAWTKVVANFLYLLGRADTADAAAANDIAALVATLATKAPLDSPIFTGAPKVPTAPAAAVGTQAASVDFVRGAITALVNSSPAALDTLKELADAIGDDPNFAATIAAQLGLKAPLDSPTFTGQPKAPTPAAGDLSTRLATTAFAAAAGAAGQITGFLPTAISGASTTAAVSISGGAASDSTNAAMIAGGPFSWAASNGNAANGFQGGATLPASSTVHFFTMKGSAGVASFASTSLSPTLPSGYTYFRRIFSLRTDGSGALSGGTATEIGGGALSFDLAAAPTDANTNVSTSRVLLPLTVPTGIRVQPNILHWSQSPTSSYILTNGDGADVAPNAGPAAVATGAPGVSGSNTNANLLIAGSTPGGFFITNTSGQIGARASAPTTNVTVVTRGFVDFRRS
ncbi:MAG: hypothetical protein K2X54_16070 [Methylobacterium organophilum]|nr:hypothetical protein [Methylobacterium organophilum]